MAARRSNSPALDNAPSAAAPSASKSQATGSESFDGSRMRFRQGRERRRRFGTRGISQRLQFAEQRDFRCRSRRIVLGGKEFRHSQPCTEERFFRRGQRRRIHRFQGTGEVAPIREDRGPNLDPLRFRRHRTHSLGPEERRERFVVATESPEQLRRKAKANPCNDGSENGRSSAARASVFRCSLPFGSSAGSDSGEVGKHLREAKPDVLREHVVPVVNHRRDGLKAFEALLQISDSRSPIRLVGRVQLRGAKPVCAPAPRDKRWPEPETPAPSGCPEFVSENRSRMSAASDHNARRSAGDDAVAAARSKVVAISCAIRSRSTEVLRRIVATLGERFEVSRVTPLRVAEALAIAPERTQTQGPARRATRQRSLCISCAAPAWAQTI